MNSNPDLPSPTGHLTRRAATSLGAGALLATACGGTARADGADAALAPVTRSTADTPALDEVGYRLRRLIGNTAVGAVASVRGPYGHLDVAAGRQSVSTDLARVNCRARVSSITKMMVATVVMQYVQSRTWRLNTTIDEVLPGLWPGRGDVTLHQLLSHTSGMPDALSTITPGSNMYEQSPASLEEACSQQYTDAEIVALARKLPWKFTPGDGYAYSNTGFVVVGMMLERVSGRSLENLLRTRVFEPAGMNQTSLVRGFTVPTPQLYDYIVEPEGRYRLERLNLSTFSGAGAVMATSADITDFLYNLFRGRLVSQWMVDLMCTGTRASRPYSYGLGMRFLPDEVTGRGTLYGHTGSGWGSVAHALSSRDGRHRMAYVATGRPYWWDGKAVMDQRRADLRDAAMRATVSTQPLAAAGRRTVPDAEVTRGAARYDAVVADRLE